MKTVFVTGSNGFLGSAITAKLGSVGDLRILAPSRKELDLADLPSVNSYWEINRPDFLIHVAAFARGLGGNLEAKEEAFLKNEEVIRTPLLAALKYGVDKVIFCGTVAEYAYPYDRLPLKEADVSISLPHSGELYYGLAKRLSNQYLEAIRARWGAAVTHTYLTNLYGPGDRFDAESGHVVASMILKLSNAAKNRDKSVDLWGSPATTRDFLFVKDAADAIAGLLGCSPKILLDINVASGTETEMAHLASSIASAVGFDGNIFWDSTKPIGIESRSIDISRLQGLMDFNPRSLAAGIAQTVLTEAWTQK